MTKRLIGVETVFGICYAKYGGKFVEAAVDALEAAHKAALDRLHQKRAEASVFLVHQAARGVQCQLDIKGLAACAADMAAAEEKHLAALGEGRVIDLYTDTDKRGNSCSLHVWAVQCTLQDGTTYTLEV